MIPAKSVREINGQKVYLSRHATERIQDMALDPAEVVCALTNPDDVVESLAYPGAMNRRFGRVTLATKFDGDVMVVVTAVWSSREDWQRDFDVAPYSDRERRESFGLTGVGAPARP
ncbi:hypothetical protein ACH47B_13020 [Rhodococcus sp. NPDC019627]|uniref:hypothetical protein n=1 Tax=unclassified Rhodococcus (in: high G+C Gram-positive bacteria) TaxID=192944 RepID=UPI0033D3D125